MSRQLIIRPTAETDITSAALWYDEKRPGLGLQFLKEVNAAMERAAAHPLRLQRLRRKPDVRKILTDRFPFRIFFVVESTRIVVFRVLHGSRHDREWEMNIPSE